MNHFHRLLSLHTRTLRCSSWGGQGNSKIWRSGSTAPIHGSRGSPPPPCWSTGSQAPLRHRGPPRRTRPVSAPVSAANKSNQRPIFAHHGAPRRRRRTADLQMW